ncbi:hypothetical protein HZ326_3156 [Fusarium oxysporum f. sp. albedinis]|nr:hypothetical protein HZ326_3156 [Fusarium oxysporum f. sp. albedinis]
MVPWSSWLWHLVNTEKVPGSIPGGTTFFAPCPSSDTYFCLGMMLGTLPITNALQIQPYHQLSLSQDLAILHPAPRNGLLMRSMESSAWKDSHNSNESEELKGFSRQLVL